MAQSSLTIGRVTADLELKTSQNLVPYVRFTIAENTGNGRTRTTQYPQVWARGEAAKTLVSANVKKGSLIWVSGSIMLEEFTRQDGKPDKRLKITMESWGHILSGIQNAVEDASDTSVEEIDGDSQPLPE